MSDYDILAKVAKELRQIAMESNIAIVTAQQHPRPPRYYSVAEHVEILKSHKGPIFIDPLNLHR